MGKSISKYRLWLGAVVPTVLAGGFFWPYAGLIVPGVMAGGLGTAALGKGRFFCGYACPRGAFLGEWLRGLRQRRVPPPLRTRVRWLLLPLLLGFMGWRLWSGPFTGAYVGQVFWTMCVVTTALALLLALAYRSRAWCAVCPIGTLSSVLRQPSPYFRPPEKCVGCRLCDKACPIDLEPSRGLQGSAGDCLRCGVCARACPLTRKSSRRDTTGT